MNSCLPCRLRLVILIISLSSCAHIPGWRAPEVEQLRQQAEAGDAVSQYQMGILYDEGMRVLKDKTAAVHWYTKAADQGHAGAEYRLGSAYYGGRGVAKDQIEAVKWLHKAAARGEPAAQYLLGVAYRDGGGVEKDAAWGARWYGLSAQQGHKPAQFALGLAFASGDGLPEQPVQACKWLTLAERSGHAAAEKEHEKLTSKMAEWQLSRCRVLADSWRPIFQVGNEDKPTIRYVQYELIRQGYRPGSIDGINGPRTQQAIEKYWARLNIGGAWTWEEIVLWLRGED